MKLWIDDVRPAPYNEDGERAMTPYCPHCGAKMKRKDDQQWQQEKIR